MINAITLQLLQICIGQVPLLSPCREACWSAVMSPCGWGSSLLASRWQLLTGSDQNEVSLSAQDASVHHDARTPSEVQGAPFLIALNWQVSLCFQNNFANLKLNGRQASQSLTINPQKGSFLLFWQERRKLEDPSQTYRANFNLSVRPSPLADV